MIICCLIKRAIPTQTYMYVLIALLTSLLAVPSQANEDQCTAVQASVSLAGFAESVDVSCQGEYTIILTNTYPDHELMTGIVGTNEHGLQSGKPPAGGVDALVYTEYSSGKRRMQYSYKSEIYYIEYTNSKHPNCLQIVSRTVTNRGVVKSGEYCRE